MKKISKISLILGLLIILITSIHTQNAYATSKEAFEYFQEQGFVKAKTWREFKPRRAINRAEFIKFLTLANGVTEKEMADCIQNKIDQRQRFVYFRDVKINAWYAPYVCVAKEKKILLHNQKKFKPAKPVSWLEGIMGTFHVFPSLHPHPSRQFSSAKAVIKEGYKLKFIPYAYPSPYKKISRLHTIKFLHTAIQQKKVLTDSVNSQNTTLTSSNNKKKIQPREETKIANNDDENSGNSGRNETLLFNPPANESSPEPFINNPILPTIDTRALWVREEAESLLGNEEEQSAFIEFLNAPHDNPDYAINRVFLAIKPASLDDSNKKVQLRNLIQLLHQNNIVVEFLTGDANWLLNGQANIPADLCNKIIEFNLASAETDNDFDGIHFDIEPHQLGEKWRYNSEKGEDIYNDAIEENFINILKTCHQSILDKQQNLSLSIDLGTDYVNYAIDLWKPLTASDRPVDYITIMNYFDNEANFISGKNGIGGVENNINFGNNTPMIFGIETGTETIALDNISFHQEGYLAMESMIQKVKSRFGHKPALRGFAIHYYGSYKELIDKPIIVHVGRDRSGGSTNSIFSKYPSYDSNNPFHRINNYYADYNDMDDEAIERIIASKYDMTILHPVWVKIGDDYISNNLTEDEVSRLKSSGAIVIAYVSFGEDDKCEDDPAPVMRSYYIDRLPADGVPDANPKHGSCYINANDDWQDIIRKKLNILQDIGVDGVFMDTLGTAGSHGPYRDSQETDEEFDDLRQELHNDYIKMVKDAKREFSGLYFVANRGFDLTIGYPRDLDLPAEETIIEEIDAVMYESFKAYKENNTRIANLLNELRMKPDGKFFHILGLQYDPDGTETQKYMDGFAEYDMLPFVAPGENLSWE